MRSIDDARDAGALLLPLIGRVVTRFCLDFAVNLEFLNAEPAYYLCIESDPLLSQDENEVTLSLDDRAQAARLSIVARKIVRDVRVYENGALIMSFGERLKLSVPANTKYEAWNVSASDGMKIVCMPGGRLAIWSPNDRADS
jgi:hypothetical protein